MSILGACVEAIEAQPDVLRSLVDDRQAHRQARRLAGTERILLVGTGTSFHGALVGQNLFRSVGMEAWAVQTSEFATHPPVLRPNDALVLVSHRGASPTTAAVLERFQNHSDRWIVVTGAASPLDGPGVLCTGTTEECAVHTVSHTAAMFRLAQLAEAHAGDRRPRWSDDLGRLPDAARVAIELRPEVAAALDCVELSGPVHYLGAGPTRPTALEGALKLRELTRLPAEGYDSDQILVEPRDAIKRPMPDEPVIVITPPPSADDPEADDEEPVAPEEEPSDHALTLAAVRALLSTENTVVVLGSPVAELPVAASIRTPRVAAEVAPIVDVIPLQWLAVEARRRLERQAGLALAQLR
jgi:glutamine---fructose-6-phosphate transaminase (isomerizing)